MERGWQAVDLPAAPRGQMARWQAVYGGRREMHLGAAARHRAREAARQPAQDLVSEPGKGHDQRRPRGHLPPEAAAAGIPVAARRGLVAGLSLPCAGQGHAHQADRHRPVQICRVPPQRGDQDRPQPGLLETGPALSRRHRMADHAGNGDPQPRVHRRQARHRFALRHDRAAARRTSSSRRRRRIAC